MIRASRPVPSRSAADPSHRARRFATVGAPAGLVLLASSLLLTRLGEGCLRLDSLLYAAISWMVAEGGGWDRLWFGYEPYFNKPPLLFWTVALCFRACGVSEAAARLPSVLAGGAVLWMLYRIARLRGCAPASAALAAAAMLVSPIFLEHVIACRMESMLLAGLLGGALALSLPPGPAAASLLAGATAVGWMAKGPAALLYVPVLAALRAGTPRSARLSWRHCAIAQLAGLVPFGLWVLRQHQVHPGTFLEQALRREVGGRLDALGFFERLAFYVPEALLGAAPLLLALALTFRGARRRGRSGAAPSARLRADAAWLGIAALFALAVQPPAGRYLLPALPAAALLLAALADRASATDMLARRLPPALAAAAALIALTALTPLRLRRPPPAEWRQVARVLAAEDADRRELLALRPPHWETKAFLLYYAQTFVLTLPDPGLLATYPGGVRLLLWPEETVPPQVALEDGCLPLAPQRLCRIAATGAQRQLGQPENGGSHVSGVQNRSM